MELRGLRDMHSAVNNESASSSTPFPVLATYEQIVGCILESLRMNTVSLEDFERGVDAVKLHFSQSNRRLQACDSHRQIEIPTPTGSTSSVTPIQRRERARSMNSNSQPLPLSLEEEEAGFRCDRKWSLDTASTSLPQSCTNERRLKVVTSLPCCSPTIGCSPAPNIPLPPASPSTFTLPRQRGFSSYNQEAPTPSPNQTPLFTPVVAPITPRTPAQGPIGFSDVTLGDVVGSGSFGVVYRARVNTTGQLIVVKVVSFDSQDKLSLAHAEALENELALLQSLQHSRIVRYLGHERITGRIDNIGASPGDECEKLLVMCEYMPGGSIAGAIRQFGPFDEKAIALHTRQILEGLSFLHDNRVCHRDLKCDNVLIDVNGSCKLADFGCSKRLDISPEGTTVIMKSMKGSIPWMAPEVLMGQGYGRSSDVWALGCVVLEMALGRNPWGHFDNIMQAMYRIGMGTKGPEIPDFLSEPCKSFVKLCLNRDPKSRPSISELIDEPFVNFG